MQMPSKERFSLSYTSSDGVRKHKDFYGKSKRIAKRKAEQFLKHINDTSYSSNMLFTVWCDEYMRLYIDTRNLSPNTYTSYVRMIKKIKQGFPKRQISSIRPADIIEWINSVKSDGKNRNQLISSGYAMNLLSFIKSIFNAAIDNGIVYTNPARSVHPPKRKVRYQRRAYNLEEARIFSNYAAKHPDGLLPFIAIHTGLRPSEIMGLKPSDFNIKEGVLTVNRVIIYDGNHINNPVKKDHGKTKSAMRHIILDDQMIEKIDELKIPKNEYIFGGVAIQKYQYRYKLFQCQLTKSTQLEKRSLYELRHTWFTLMRAINDLRTVDLQGGHQLGSLTDDVYAHYDVDFLKANTHLIEW